MVMSIKKLRYGVKLQINALAIHVLAICGLIYYWDPLYLLLFLLGNKLIIGVGHDIGMHRYFAHRSFKTHRWVEWIFMSCIWYTSQGSTLGWIARHRLHHRYSDQPNDPHPSKDWLSTWLWIDTEAERNVKVTPSLVKDLIRKPEHIFMRNHYFKVYWGSLILFSLLLGPKFVVYFFLLNGVAGFHSAGIINVLCHKWGYRNFETNDYSKNLAWANILYVGWHNNHHAKPNSWTMQYLPHEWDTGAWLIKHVFATNKHELKPMMLETSQGK